MRLKTSATARNGRPSRPSWPNHRLAWTGARRTGTSVLFASWKKLSRKRPNSSKLKYNTDLDPVQRVDHQLGTAQELDQVRYVPEENKKK